MTASAGILARGPWRPEDVEVTWRHEPFAPPAEVIQEADQALAELRGRGSPSHDGLAGRLRDFRAGNRRLKLECEPIRWALRLLPGNANQSLSALCIVRSADGCWLAGRRAAWLADGAEVMPDEEHDAFAWWPKDPERWPGDADEPLKRIAALLAG